MEFITGSSGFIGRNLVARLNNPIRIPHEDILYTDWSKATKVYFLSAYGNMYGQNDDQETIKANLIDLCFVLASIDWNKIESFVYISTSSVKLKRQTMYSRSKKAAEEILLAYMEKYDAPITIIRPTSVYGPNEQPQHLIPVIIESIKTGKLMNFVREPVHDYIFIDDLVDGIINLSENKAKGIFELGTGIKTSNQEVIDILEEIIGKKANTNIVEKMRDYDNKEWVSENFKSRGFGWLPKTSLFDGLKITVSGIIEQ